MGTGEIIGWSGRLWSNKNLNLDTPFMMQIASYVPGPPPYLPIVVTLTHPRSLIISPVFFSAFNYTMLGKAVEKINPTYCMLTSKMVCRCASPLPCAEHVADHRISSLQSFCRPTSCLLSCKPSAADGPPRRNSPSRTLPTISCSPVSLSSSQS